MPNRGNHQAPRPPSWECDGLLRDSKRLRRGAPKAPRIRGPRPAKCGAARPIRRCMKRREPYEVLTIIPCLRRAGTSG